MFTQSFTHRLRRERLKGKVQHKNRYTQCTCVHLYIYTVLRILSHVVVYCYLVFTLPPPRNAPCPASFSPGRRLCLIVSRSSARQETPPSSLECAAFSCSYPPTLVRGRRWKFSPTKPPRGPVRTPRAPPPHTPSCGTTWTLPKPHPLNSSTV